MSLHTRPTALPRQVHSRALAQSQQLYSGEDQRKLGEEGREERGDRGKRGKKRGKRREEERRKGGREEGEREGIIAWL